MTSGKVSSKKNTEGTTKFANAAKVSAITLNTMNRINEQLAPLTKKMYDPQSPLIPVFNIMEKVTGSKREDVTYFTFILLTVYALSGSMIQLIANAIGFIYPAYVTLQLFGCDRSDDLKKWLSYWLIFSFSTIMDLTVASSFPLYYLLKTLFLMYLYLPNFDGATVMFKRILEPTQRVVKEIVTVKQD